MRLLNTVNKCENLPSDVLNYIKRYRKIYKNVILEARRKENDRIIQNSQNITKKMWQIVNKETSNSVQVYHPTSLEKGKCDNIQPSGNGKYAEFLFYIKCG
jgi:hypothetical protein